ncbi:MAG: CAP domain-containing protein [Terracidiphilus sp.]
MNILGKHRCVLVAAALLILAAQISAHGQNDPALQPEAEQLLALANHARAEAGVPPLHWDGALAEAARKHTLRMTAEGPIAHRYGGELSLTERAAAAGAHFDLIEENVAIGPTPAAIHEEWMKSIGHRQNMLNPAVDRVGFALVASRGVLYATADYAHGVQQLSQIQVEGRVAALIRPSGVAILGNPSVARAACTMDSGLPRSAQGMQPSFVMRWQDSDLNHLPKTLVDQLASGRYREAAVGSCNPTDDSGSFTAYRIAVLLY